MGLAVVCPAVSMWGHENMHLLPAVPFCLLVCVTAWLVWPMLADPLARHLGQGEDDEKNHDDPLRAWAELARPDIAFARTDRG